MLSMKFEPDWGSRWLQRRKCWRTTHKGRSQSLTIYCVLFIHIATLLRVFQWRPGSLVSSDAGCQARGCEFETELGKHSLRRLTKVIGTCVIHHGLTAYVEKQPVAWKVWRVQYWYENARKCTRRWKLLKTALNPNQSPKEKIGV